MKRTRILIVEDEGIIARDIERLLVMLDYEPVGIAVEGLEAIQLAGELRPQLVLMDIHLAGDMDGIDAAAAIRAQFGIPSVFLTAYATDDVVERAKRAEPLGYIIKPFDQLSLRTTIEIALHKDQIDAGLRHSEARFRAVVDTANDAVVTADQEGTIVGWSPAAVAIFGYSEAEAIGQPVAMLVPARYQDGHLTGIANWRSDPGSRPRLKAREMDGRRKDGTEFPLELSLAAWEAAGRRYVTAFIHDISERRGADEALRLANRVIENSSAVLFRGRVEKNWPVEFVSGNIERQFGYAVDDLISGRVPFESAIHPGDRARILAESAKYLAGGTDRYSQEFRVVAKDGSIHWVEFRNTVERDANGQPRNIEGVLQDITERKIADSALRLQSDALNAVANAVVISDPEGRIEWVNAAFTVMTGYSADEVIGKQGPELISSGDPAIQQQLADTLFSGKMWSGEVTSHRKNGTPYIEELSVTPLKEPDGHVHHFIGIHRDVTDKKQLQEQFLQAQKMEVVGRLAGGVAHDFNNLLTIINGESELALLDLAEDHPLRPSFENIVEAGNRAVRLTRQLLTFSRKQVATPLVISVSAQVAILAQMLTRLIGEDVQLVIAAPTGQAADRVLIDPGQLEQVLLNLAVNARDAMPAGGALTIDTRLVDLDAAFAAAHPGITPGPHVMLTVSDTGIGMSAEVRSHIFEPFFTTKRPGTGTGLGLAMVYGIVRQCGGVIDVDSEPGVGTSFRMFLPSAAGKTANQVTETAKSARGTETILLVEDEDTVRELTARMLTSAGYTVTAVCGASEALAVLQRQNAPVHLLLTDVVMPGMNGTELAAEVAKTRPHLRVLFASGYTGDRIGPEATADPNRFIAKPFTVVQLTTKVRSVLDAPETS